MVTGSAWSDSRPYGSWIPGCHGTGSVAPWRKQCWNVLYNHASDSAAANPDVTSDPPRNNSVLKWGLGEVEQKYAALASQLQQAPSETVNWFCRGRYVRTLSDPHR